MLVLSRKKDQRILFPALGITLEVLRVSGNTVSVGIEAPQSIRVLRGELQQAIESALGEAEQSSDEKSEVPPASQKKLSHEMRNHLNKIFLAISLVQKQLSRGMNEEAEATLQEAFQSLLQLDQGVEIESNEQTAAVDRNSKLEPSQPAKSSKRTLLVEDDPNEQALLAGYLRMSGYQVLTASDGVEALELLSREPVDLIVLDMRMPRMNGAETLKAIRKDPFLKDVKVVVVSGEEPKTALGKTSSRGVSEWFSKPLDPAKLIEHLESSMN